MKKKTIEIIIEQGLRRKLKGDSWLINDPAYFNGARAICIVFRDGKKEYQIAVRLPD